MRYYISIYFYPFYRKFNSHNLLYDHCGNHNIRACTFGAALCQVLCGRSRSLSRRPTGGATKTTLAPCTEGQKHSPVWSCLMWLHYGNHNIRTCTLGAALCRVLCGWSRSLSRRPTDGATKITLASCTEGHKRSSGTILLIWLHLFWCQSH